MIRTTYDEVLTILDNDVVVSVSQTTAMITAASLVIDQIFVNDTSVTTIFLTELERWLTAHFIVTTIARMASKEKVGEAEIIYAGKWGEGLSSTPYGQMLLILDVTGKLAKMGKMAVSLYAIPNFDK